ncbi:hypothetical protein BDV23DRAFT_184836 [Aspergillus alliaceus]|uniref:Carrier domain-containing protein n=1 Tax=Petromyces alliaceus TaxID=209559 RepID=A0A5N7C4G9_PETAA|nr:hypothetical protein BDV23DRAFT_184836 [Aspergillus alliaceus]
MIKAVLSLHLEWKEAGTMQPAVRDMINHSLICFDPSRVFYLDPVATDPVRSLEDRQYTKEFSQLTHFVSHSRTQKLLHARLDDVGVEILQGRQVYRAFGMFVDYSDIYRGVRYVVGCGNECAGVVQLDMKHRCSDTWLDVPLSDSFAQIGGMWTNLMSPETSTANDDIYIAKGVKLLMRAPSHKMAEHAAVDMWHWGRVAKASMNRMLRMRTKDESVLRLKPVPNVHSHQLKPALRNARINTTPTVNSFAQKPSPKSKAQSASSSARRDMTDEVRGLVARLTGIEASELELDAEITHYGSDSLMGMELGREVERMFKCTLDQAQQMEATTLRKFVACVENALFGQDSSEATDERNPPTEPERQSSNVKSRDMTEAVRNLVATVTGLDPNEMPLDAEIVDFWIDSLMGKELGHEVERVFACTLDQTEQVNANTLRKRRLGTIWRRWDFSGNSSAVVLVEHDAVFSDSWPESSALLAPPPEAKPTTSPLAFSMSDILTPFGQVKLATDQSLSGYHLDQFERSFLADSNRLCTILVIEAFDKIGCHLRTSAAGQPLNRVRFALQHTRLRQWLYGYLERDARLVDTNHNTGQVTRTWLTVPPKTSHAMLQDLLSQHPNFVAASRLTYHVDQELASMLSGKTDGQSVLFGSPDGLGVIAALYTEFPFFRAGCSQMCEIVKGVFDRLPVSHQGETFKVLEVGAGTGGLTHVMASLLASLDVPVEYTFTDASPLMVADARRHLEHQYRFMRFVVHDKANVADQELRGQHLVLANTPFNVTSLSNVRPVLRSDGFLVNYK